MRRRLALYVCPREKCPAIGGRSKKCPTHRVLLERHVYVHHAPAPPLKPTDDLKVQMAELLKLLPRRIRKVAERIAREAGYIE